MKIVAELDGGAVSLFKKKKKKQQLYLENKETRWKCLDKSCKGCFCTCSAQTW